MVFLYAALCECDEYHLSVGMPEGDTKCSCGLSVDRLDFIPIKPLSLATEEELSAITEA